MLFLLAVLLPGLYWQGGAQTAASLRNAGIKRVCVPASELASWKSVEGIKAEPADLQGAVKLPAPGMVFRMNQASATRTPWVNSNGWHLMRKAGSRFYYDVDSRTAPLAAAEAFTYGAQALVQTKAEGVAKFAEMVKFLGGIAGPEGEPVADIGFIDDGSAASAEVMNLLVRDNFLFKIVSAPDPSLKLNVKIGSPEYPAKEAQTNPVQVVSKIRANLTDARRSLRVYGTSIVVAHVTEQPGRLRVQFLNYGSAQGARVGAFRVRVAGRYAKGELHSFGRGGDKLSDFEPGSDATEFTVPELNTYAVVDLYK